MLQFPRRLNENCVLFELVESKNEYVMYMFDGRQMLINWLIVEGQVSGKEQVNS